MIERPTMMQLETSTACNAKCIFCPHKDLKRRGGLMDEALFRKIIAEVAELGFGEVLLFLNGEPLLFPKFFEWLELLREHGLTTTIFTNAAKLNSQKGLQLLEYSDLIRTIVFSLGGIDKQTYEEIMALDYDIIRSNVETFVDLNDGKILLEGHVPLMSRTAPFMKTWLAMWGDFMPSAPTPMYNYAGLINDAMELGETETLKRQACGRLHHVTALWDGRVCLCCMDAEGQVILGDLNEQGIMEVFKGKRALHYRTMHEAGRFDELELCRDCNMNIIPVTQGG